MGCFQEDKVVLHGHASPPNANTRSILYGPSNVSLITGAEIRPIKEGVAWSTVTYCLLQRVTKDDGCGLMRSGDITNVPPLLKVVNIYYMYIIIYINMSTHIHTYIQTALIIKCYDWHYKYNDNLLYCSYLYY